jgi:poly(hydroxyalkanoate) granule-associated protein
MAESKSVDGLRARLRQVQSTFRKAQAEGERVIERIRKDAGDLLGKNRKKAVQDLLAQAQKLRGDLQKRAERAMKDLEERGQKIVSAIEKQAEKSVEPIVRGLNLPTRDEVEKLKKKVAHIEKRLEELAGSKAA